MNFVYFLIFSVVIFLLSLISYEKFRTTTLYALAIGGAVNANFFHAGNYPINCFGLPFGIDSIIYSVFAFCVVVMFLKANKKEAYILMFSSVIAIMFSACMQLVADLFTKGSSLAIWQTFFCFCVSSAATVIAVCEMLEILQKLKEKGLNQYLLMVIGMAIVLFINSIIYYPIIVLINNTPANLWQQLLTSVIGKAIGIVCAIGSLYLMSKLDIAIQKRKNKKEADKVAKNNETEN